MAAVHFDVILVCKQIGTFVCCIDITCTRVLQGVALSVQCCDLSGGKFLQSCAPVFKGSKKVETHLILAPPVKKETMAKPSSQILELNIGGTSYSTTIATLTSAFPGSKLAASVGAFIAGKTDAPGGVAFLRDSNQRMFIDRDGPCFRYVLDFLRNGGGAATQSEMVLKTCPDPAERQRVRNEAEFYGLDELASVLKKLEARQVFISGRNDQTKSKGDEPATPLYPRLYQGPSPISRSEGDSPCRSLDRVMSTGSLSQNRPFYITIGYRSSCSATRDSTSLEKFRRITRITVSGRSDIAKEIFRDDLNDSRDPDRYPSDGYTSRYYLKHNYLEHAFETLASRGFLLSTSCSSGSKTLPAQAKEYKQWTTYIEYVFYRPPWDE